MEGLNGNDSIPKWRIDFYVYSPHFSNTRGGFHQRKELGNKMAAELFDSMVAPSHEAERN